jgi:3-oxoadipate enol-lactonase
MKIKANGIQINYTVEGQGPWVVMSHSLACNLSMWDEQAAVLSKRYKVLRYDLRGHGGTDAPAGDYTFDMLAYDAHALLEALGITSCHWVGLSIGGMIGQAFALKFPGVFSTLVLADTTSRNPPEARPVWEARVKTAREKGMDAVVEPTLQRWLTEPYRKAHPQTAARLSAMIRSTPVAGYAGCCAAIPTLDFTGQLKTIRCPTLVIVGEQDPGAPPEVAKVIHREIAGSELVIIPSAAHIANLEQTAAFNRALVPFLDKHRA